MNIMDTYNGYKANKDTWHAMLYLNNDLYNNVYKTVYTMIKNKDNKILVCIYMGYSLQSFIEKNNLKIDIKNIDYDELYINISTDVFHETNNIN
jgi:hypothetical protein